MKIYILDCETTGLSKNDQVIQLAHLQIPNERSKVLAHTPAKDNSPSILEKHSSYYCPTVRINPRAQEVHGLSRIKLMKYPLATGVKFGEQAALIVGHNIQFDIRMISYTDTKVLKIPLLCTMNLIKRVEKVQGGKFGLDNYKLATIHKFFYPELTVDYSKHHNALTDCVMNLEVLVKILENFPFLSTLTEMQEYFFPKKK